MMPPLSSGQWPLMILTLPQNYFLQVSLANRKQAVYNFSMYLLGQQVWKNKFHPTKVGVFFFQFSLFYPDFWSNKRCWKMLKLSEAMKKVLAPGRRGGWREQKKSPMAWWGHGYHEGQVWNYSIIQSNERQLWYGSLLSVFLCEPN